jgi:hypothetical protein
LDEKASCATIKLAGTRSNDFFSASTLGIQVSERTFLQIIGKYSLLREIICFCNRGAIVRFGKIRQI